MKSALALIVTVLGVQLAVHQAHANASPYATDTSNVPLNQSSTDDLNGRLTTSSTNPVSGNLSSLTDAISSSSPTEGVIVGPDDATVNLSWDFGAAGDAASRRLETLSIWFAAEGSGFRGSLATSLDGLIYVPVADSTHEVFFPSAGVAGGVVANFHNVLYDFSGTNVSNFRFLQLSVEAFAFPGNTAFQPRIVEIDAVIVPEPSTIALLALGAGVVGLAARRKKQ